MYGLYYARKFHSRISWILSAVYFLVNRKTTKSFSFLKHAKAFTQHNNWIASLAIPVPIPACLFNSWKLSIAWWYWLTVTRVHQYRAAVWWRYRVTRAFNCHIVTHRGYWHTRAHQYRATMWWGYRVTRAFHCHIVTHRGYWHTRGAYQCRIASSPIRPFPCSSNCRGAWRTSRPFPLHQVPLRECPPSIQPSIQIHTSI